MYYIEHYLDYITLLEVWAEAFDAAAHWVALFDGLIYHVLLVVVVWAVYEALKDFQVCKVVAPAVLDNGVRFQNRSLHEVNVHLSNLFAKTLPVDALPDVNLGDLPVHAAKAEEHVVHQLRVLGLEQPLVVV